MRHFLNPLDFSVEELEQVLALAEQIRQHPEEYAHVADGQEAGHSVL